MRRSSVFLVGFAIVTVCGATASAAPRPRERNYEGQQRLGQAPRLQSDSSQQAAWRQRHLPGLVRRRHNWSRLVSID